MPTYHFDCVFYYVHDLERAVRFYERAFGFQVASRDSVARFHVDAVLFELVPSGGADHFSGHGNARLVLSVADLEEATADLRQKHVPTSEIQVVSNGRFATATDPDGNEIVIWQYARGIVA